ncbi:MAG: pectate lyase, partial [Prevotella sp.]|nr:pectate lyase [Prevotella sp.]
HVSRVPRLGPRYTTQLDERMDMRNNVFYNWAGNGCYGGEAMNVNIVNNYYKPGPATDKASSRVKYRIAGIGIRTNDYIKTYPDYAPTLHKWGTFYVAGNVNPDHKDKITAEDQWTHGIYAQVETNKVDNTFTEQVKKDMRLSAPINFLPVTTHTAEQAYTNVLAYAGASLSRDSHDSYIVEDVKNRTASHTGEGCLPGIVNDQYEAGDFPQLKEEYPDVRDSDGDGMPDEWEDANGLDKYNAADGATVTADGYTNLEHYLNSLVAHITEAQNANAATAIEEIKGASLANTPQNNNVYTLDGRCVRKDAESLAGLARGMYIHKGKTVVID